MLRGFSPGSKFYKSRLFGRKFSDLPLDEIFELIELERAGLGRGQKGSGPREWALIKLHRRFCKLRNEEERERLLLGVDPWELTLEKAPTSDSYASTQNDSVE